MEMASIDLFVKVMRALEDFIITEELSNKLIKVITEIEDYNIARKGNK